MNAVIRTVFDEIVTFFKINPARLVAYIVAADLILRKADDFLAQILAAVAN